MYPYNFSWVTPSRKFGESFGIVGAEFYILDVLPDFLSTAPMLRSDNVAPDLVVYEVSLPLTLCLQPCCINVVCEIVNPRHCIGLNNKNSQLAILHHGRGRNRQTLYMY